MFTDKSTSIGLVLFFAISLSGCGSNEAQLTTSASVNPTAQQLTTAKATSGQLNNEAGEEVSPDSQDAKDPGFLAANNAVQTFARAYWDERFVKCGKNQQGDERWFSVQETSNASRYLEVINLKTLTSPPARLSSADRLNRVWHATSVVQSTAYRWCDEGPCGEYSGGVVGLELGSKGYAIAILVKDGKASSKDNPDSLYRPSCEEIKKHPIWKEY